jgi:hypothetical protein
LCREKTSGASISPDDFIPPPGCSPECGEAISPEWQRVLAPPYSHFITLEYQLTNIRRQRPNQTLLRRGFNFRGVGFDPDSTAIAVCKCLEFLMHDRFTPKKVLFYGYEANVFGFWLLAVQRKVLDLLKNSR